MKHLFFGGVHPADRKELAGASRPRLPFPLRWSSPCASTSAHPAPLW